MFNHLQLPACRSKGLRRHGKELLSAAALAVLSCALATPALAQARAHKALYDITLVEKGSSSQIVNISGHMYYAVNRTCDAWTTDHRFQIAYDYADSPAMVMTSDFSAYELNDGSSLSFNSRRNRNGEAVEEFSGQASTGQGEGMADYSLPSDLKMPLPPGTLFPMAHTIELLRQAKAGKKFYTATIFDGSDDEGPVQVSAFIGKPVPAPTAVAADSRIDPALRKRPGWKVRMAFFPLNDPEAEGADYEMDALLLDNGVIDDMRIEYRDFTVTQDLTALEPMPNVNCASAPATQRPQPVQ